MCHEAPPPPCLFPPSTCEEEESVQEIRAAGEVRGTRSELKHTKHYFAFDPSRCSFGFFQQYFDNRQHRNYLKTYFY